MSSSPEPSAAAIQRQRPDEPSPPPPSAIKLDIPPETSIATPPTATRGVKRKRPAFLDRLKESQTRATSRYAHSPMDPSRVSPPPDVSPDAHLDHVELGGSDDAQTQRVSPIEVGSPADLGAQDEGAGEQPPSSDVPGHGFVDHSREMTPGDPQALPAPVDMLLDSNGTEDAQIKDFGMITSSLSVLSNTPELSQTPVPSASNDHHNGFTSYVMDSDEGGDSDGSAIALEEDAAAPKHELRVERSQTAFDSDSDSSLVDFEALKRGPSKARSSSANRSSVSSKFSVKKRVLSSSTFSELVRQSEDEAKRNVDIQEARQVLEASTAGEATPEMKSDGHFLAALVSNGDDAGVVDRMKQAMDRTDVMIEDTSWHFFSKEPPIQYPLLFPASLPLAYSWVADQNSREQALLSGYARKALCGADLPPELLAWMWDEYFATLQDELAFAYLDCLEDFAGTETTSTRLEKVLKSWGTRPQVFERDQELIPDTRYKTAPPASSRALKRLLALTWRVSHIVSMETVKLTLEVFLRLALDSSLIVSRGLRGDLQHCFYNLLHRLSAVPTDECPLPDISANLVRTLKHPVLQWKLISVLPITSLEAHSFARHLALAFFLDSAGYLTFPLASADSLTSRIVKKLQHETMATKHSTTDYASMAASINILDVAIGEGFGRPDPSAPKQEHKTFNATVDKQSSALAQLSARIIDTGASHMQRTEAKGAVARLVARLEHAVRTEPKPVSHVLDDARWSAADRGQTADRAASATTVPGRRRTLDAWVHPAKDKSGDIGDTSVQQASPIAPAAPIAPAGGGGGTALETGGQHVKPQDGGACAGPGASDA